EEALPTMQALLAAMQPNRELMRRRAAEGFSSVTALAEMIQTRTDLSYRTAHRVAARAVRLAVERGRDATGIDTALLEEAARETIGKPLALDAAAIAQCLDPQRFIAQHAVTGGPAPQEVRRMIAQRRQLLQADQENLSVRRQALAAGAQRLKQAVDAITKLTSSPPPPAHPAGASSPPVDRG